MPETNLAIATRSDAQPIPYDARRAALAADPFEPQDYPALWQFAETVCKTPFCPKEFKDKPGDAFVAMLYGKSLGLAALQALQGIGVINGKPSVYGETFWAVIISHPDFVDAEEETGDDGAVCVLTRRTRKPYRAEFTRADAEVARLWKKEGPWTNYPKGQMLWRARHRAATALFPDALKGILPREVALDFIEGEVLPPREAALPTASLTAAPAEPSKGSQPSPAADPVITEEQGKAWNKAWEPVFERAGVSGREHMKTRADAKRAELERIGVGRTGEMKLSQFEASLRKIGEWKSPNPNPMTAATAPGPTATAANATPSTTPETRPSTVEAAASSSESTKIPEDEPEPDENLPERTVRTWMNALGISMFEQSARIGKATDEGVVDWGRIAADLVKEQGYALRDRGLLE